MHSWKGFLSRAFVGALGVGAAVGAGVLVGVRLAGADPSGPPTRQAFTYAGVLHGADAGVHMLTFTFQKPGPPAASCGPIPVSPDVAPGGAFSVPVPIDRCPAFFDGADVTYTVAEVSVAEPLASNVPIHPVPYARYADRAGNDDCPPGWARNVAEIGFRDVDGNLRRLCQKRLLRADGTLLYVDEVVRVGTPPSVFWIDRYEASVVRAPALTNSAFESGSEPTDLLRNGRWNLEQRTSDASEALRAPYFARSIVGAAPARFVTWFQASELCRMSGKQLPTGDEWITAALGTDDPGENNGAVNSACNTLGVGPTATPRATGGGGRCRSSWGARDMIGNVWEWTTEWYAGLNDSATGDPTIAWPNPPQQRHVRRRRYLEHHFVRLSRGRRSAPCRNPCRSVPRWPLARWGPGRGVFPGPGRRALELGLPAWASAAFCDGSPPRSLAAS